MSKPRVKKTVLLLGTHGQKNLGDDLLLETFLSGLTKYSSTDLHFIINSYSVEETLARYRDIYSVQVFHTVKEVWKLPFLMIKADVVLFAGGSILKELFESTGRGRNSSLLMIAAVACLAYAIRRPIILSHIGVSNLTHRVSRTIAALTLRLASQISFRDPESMELSISVCPSVRNKCTLVPDAVFALPGLLNEHFPPRKGDKGAIRIAINLNSAVKEAATWTHFMDSLARVLRAVRLTSGRKVEFRYVSFQSGFAAETDSIVLDRFRELLEPDEEAGTIFEPTTIKSAWAYLNDADLFISERFHGLVLGLLMRIPVFAIVYDPKVLSLAKQFHLENVSTDIDPNFDLEATVDKVLRCIDSPGQSPSVHSVEAIANRAQNSFQDLARCVCHL